jgi:hypothetical protein
VNDFIADQYLGSTPRSSTTSRCSTAGLAVRCRAIQTPLILYFISDYPYKMY